MKYVLAIFSLALLVSLSHRTEAQTTAGVQIAPGQNIQSVVDAHRAGTTYVLLSGVHRMQTVTPKSGDTFTAEVPGETILNGSRVLSGWQYDGTYWYLGGQIDAQGLLHGSCENGYPRCNDSHSLFLDDQPLEHVASRTALGPNKWFFDYDADRIYVGQDPRGKVAEMSVTATAFLGGNTQNVTIENLIIEKYASQAQFGAVNGNTHTATAAVDWTIQNNIIRLNHGGGLRIAHGMTVQDNAINDNGQIGIIGVGDDVLIENNEIARNNWAHYKTIWEAGGTKFVRTNRLIVRSNFIHHNEGPGLWTDIENFNTLYEGNYVSDNRRGGLEHEISYDVIIRNNIFKRNTAMRGWLWDAQILINTSSGADVYGNVVEVPAAGGGNAITIVSQSRGSQYDGNNNYIHDNEITYLSVGGMSGAAIDYGDTAVRNTFYSTNQFDYNAYHATSLSDSHWAWDGGYKSWSSFRSAGQEANGRADTNVVPDTTPPPPVGPTWLGNGGGSDPVPQDQVAFASNLIPGTLEAENYDIGGEGIAYHDTDGGNNGGAYRFDDVDVKGNTQSGGFQVGWMNAGEWLEYTAEVAEAGSYAIDVLASTTQSDGPTFSLYIDGGFHAVGAVPNTGDWDASQPVSLPPADLTKGTHIIRVGPSVGFLASAPETRPRPVSAVPGPMRIGK